jgi:hypothetical protein
MTFIYCFTVSVSCLAKSDLDVKVCSTDSAFPKTHLTGLFLLVLGITMVYDFRF